MTETPKDICSSYINCQCSYKGHDGLYICGYTENSYLILGSKEKNLCILEFNTELPTVHLIKTYKSYRFAKPKYVELIK